MLSFLAATVPIAGALYVAFSMLIEYARGAHATRSYDRIDDWYSPRLEALDMAVLGPVEYGRQRSSLDDQRATLLKANGLDATLGTIEASNRAQRPQPPRAVDIRRQWSLLLTSTAGVILVAIDSGFRDL